MAYAERAELLRILDAYNEAHRGANGVADLTASTLRVARTMLFQLMDKVTGRLDHALVWIAKWSRRAYQTVVVAIRQLEALGVLQVQRRARRGDGPDGPPWVQDTNLYRFELPAKVRTWWEAEQRRRADRRKAWTPDDHLGAAAAAAAERAQMEQGAAEDLAAQRREAAIRHDLDLARRARGPGAAAFRAAAEARARASGFWRPPESNS